jgi:hypothetical protein
LAISNRSATAKVSARFLDVPDERRELRAFQSDLKAEKSAQVELVFGCATQRID